MKKILSFFCILSILFFFTACSKKSHPSETTTVKKNEAKKIKVALPKVIAVADSSASKTFDGRYYYDLMGHRYWRNNKDGKYYLYNKSMSTDPAFKKP